jgi:hypothetical protein
MFQLSYVSYVTSVSLPIVTRQKVKHVGGVQDTGAAFWPFSFFSINLTLSTLQYRRDSAADCCHVLTTVFAAVTSDL